MGARARGPSLLLGAAIFQCVGRCIDAVPLRKLRHHKQEHNKEFGIVGIDGLLGVGGKQRTFTLRKRARLADGNTVERRASPGAALAPDSPEYDTLYASWLRPRFAKLQRQRRQHVLERDASSTSLTSGSGTTAVGGQSPSLLIGIKSAGAWRKIRDIHRATWFADAKCVHTAGVKGGFVTPRFLLSGKPTPAQLAEQAEFGDMLFFPTGGELDDPDDFARRLPLMPADRRKVFSWFKLAAHSSKGLFNDFGLKMKNTTMGAPTQPTYIGKMDCDTFVSPCALLQDMANAGTPLYYGQMNGAKQALNDLAALQRTPDIAQCRGRPASDPFMQGGFYALSIDLARWMTDHQEYPGTMTSEDQVVGCMMRNAVKAGKAPIGALHPVVWNGSDGCDQKWCNAWNPSSGTFLFKHLWYEFAAHIKNKASGRDYSINVTDVMTLSD